MRLVGLLQIRRSAEMVKVPVTYDYIFDLLRIESSLFHAGNQNLFGVSRGIQGINYNNALACGERPCTDVVEPDKIKVVENLRRLESLPWGRRQSCRLPQYCRPLRAARRTKVRCFR